MTLDSEHGAKLNHGAFRKKKKERAPRANEQTPSTPEHKEKRVYSQVGVCGRLAEMVG